MDRTNVERWMDAYRRAWTTDAADDIAALFTEDASYKPYPWPRESRGWEGRDRIVEKWISRGDSKIGWRFDHRMLAIDGDTAVIEGWTEYDRGEGEPWQEAYANVFLVRFAPDGRAREFAEWWVQQPTD